MALKRSDIRAILKNEDSTTDEKIAEIMDILHGEVDDIKTAQDNIAEELEKTKKELEDAKNAPASDADSEWKTKYEQEHSDFEAFKQEKEVEAARNAKKEALIAVLKDLGLSIKGQEKALKYTDLETLELDEDGSIKEADTLKESIKNEWSEYVTSTSTEGAQVQTPPDTSSGQIKTKDEIFKKDKSGKYVYTATERQKLIAENQDLF